MNSMFSWVLNQAGVKHHLMGSPGKGEAAAVLAITTTAFHDLGIPIGSHKTDNLRL